MSEIKSALTAEEWTAWLKDGARVPEMVDACYTAVFGGRARDGSRHAQAAVALHGQSFGFTRDMLRALRELGHPSQTIEDMDLANVAIDRIEALLPPEEK